MGHSNDSLCAKHHIHIDMLALNREINVAIAELSLVLHGKTVWSIQDASRDLLLLVLFVHFSSESDRQ